MLLLTLLCLSLPLAALSAKCESDEHGVQFICKNVTVQELSKTDFDGKVLVILLNVTGTTRWDTESLLPVNGISAKNVSFTVEALEDFSKLPHLSSFSLEDGFVECWNKSVLPFSNKNLHRLSLINVIHCSAPPSFKFLNAYDVSLTENQFDVVPFIEGEKLRFLNLSFNKIDVIKDFPALPAVEEIDLSSNLIDAIEMNAFKNCPNLHMLELQNNRLQTLAFRAPDLKILNLSGNLFTFVTSAFFDDMPNLTVLNLERNSIDAMDDPFRSLKTLKTLDLSHNLLDKIDPLWFAKTREIEVLRISHNRISTLPTTLEPLTNLHFINVSNNALSVLDGNFFKNAKEVATLDVSNNSLVALTETHMYSKLRKLVARHNLLTEVSRDTFAPLDLLNSLDLSYNGLSQRLDVFESATSLRDVNLEHNVISELCIGNPIPKQIRNLNLKDNKVRSLRCIEHLDSLHIEGNPLTCGAELKKKLKQLGEDINFSFTPDVETVRSIKESQWREQYDLLCPQDDNTVNIAPATSQIPTSTAAKKSDADKHRIVVGTLVGVDRNDLSADEEYPGEHERDYLANPKEDEDMQSEKQSWNKALATLMKPKDHNNYPKWAKLALVLSTICTIMVVVKIVVLVILKKRRQRLMTLGCNRPYEQLHNDVYKDTTSRVAGRGQLPANVGTFVIRIGGDVLTRFKLKEPGQADTESEAKMIVKNDATVP